MKKATAALSLTWLSLCAYLLRREYFKLDVAEGEGAAGVYPAEFLVRLPATVRLGGDKNLA